MFKLAKNIEIIRNETAIRLIMKLLDGEVEITEPYRDELEQIIMQGTEKIESELEKFLFQHKYLMEEKIANSDIGQLIEIIKETIILTIMPTEKCNFKCLYCYEDHQQGNMTSLTLDHIKQFLKKELDNNYIKYVQVNWFGGEPTLCIEQVCEFNNYVMFLQKTYGFHFSSGITTNGYLLDTELFKRLYNSEIKNYQITIDGWKHDKVRMHISGKETLKKIIGNLQGISKLPIEYDFEIRMRYNISIDNQDITWYDYIKEMFGEDERFGVYINFVKDWGGDSVKTISICKNENMNEIERKHIEYMEKIGLKNYNIDTKSNLALAKVCYASYPNSYIFRANNDVVKCTVALDASENKIGWVDLEKGVMIQHKQNSLWSETTLEGCHMCKHLLSCLHRVCPRLIVVDKKPEYTCMLN